MSGMKKAQHRLRKSISTAARERSLDPEETEHVKQLISGEQLHLKEMNNVRKASIVHKPTKKNLSLFKSPKEQIKFHNKVLPLTGSETHNKRSGQRTIMQNMMHHNEEPLDDGKEFRALVDQDIQKSPWHIISPESIGKRTFDVFIAFSLFYTLITAPIRACFWVEAEGLVAVFETFMDIGFIVDIILNFNTSRVDSDMMVVVDRRTIAITYLKSWFLLDLVASLPIDMLTPATSSSQVGRIPRLFKVLKLLRLLKLLRVMRVAAILAHLETKYGVHAGFARLFRLVLLMCIVTHLVACAWFLIPNLIDDLENSWIAEEGLEDAALSAQYISAVYWAFSTLTTVGYGDITGKTPMTQLFSVFVMALGVTWYAFIVSSMSSIMSGFDTFNATLRNKMNKVNSFMRDAKLPRELRKKLRSHMDQVSMDKSNYYEAEEVLSEMPASLKTEVLHFMYSGLISQFPFLEGKDTAFAVSMIVLFRPLFVCSGENIVFEGDQANEMFFLLKGKAVAIKFGEEVSYLGPGDYFGEVGCMLGDVRHATVRAQELCELYTVLRDDLLQLTDDYPQHAQELTDKCILEIQKDASRCDSVNEEVSTEPPNVALQRMAIMSTFGTKRNSTITKAKRGTVLMKLELHKIKNNNDVSMDEGIRDELHHTEDRLSGEISQLKTQISRLTEHVLQL